MTAVKRTNMESVKYFIWYTFGKDYYRFTSKPFSTVSDAVIFAEQELKKEFWSNFQILPDKQQPA